MAASLHLETWSRFWLSDLIADIASCPDNFSKIQTSVWTFDFRQQNKTMCFSITFLILIFIFAYVSDADL